MKDHLSSASCLLLVSLLRSGCFTREESIVIHPDDWILRGRLPRATVSSATAACGGDITSVGESDVSRDCRDFRCE